MGYSENNTFDKIMSRALSSTLLNDTDKREGSIIYDALAPMALELANAYIVMDVMERQMYMQSCTGESLDKRSADYGLSRYQATKAERIAKFLKYKRGEDGNYLFENGVRVTEDCEVPEGTRFVVPNDSSMVYEYTGMAGVYRILTCETAGSVGEAYTGIVLPLSPVTDLAEARITGTYTSAQDTETDAALRKRIEEYLNEKPYGGNIADYRQKLKTEVDGVQEVKVFPAWNGNGSVLVSVVNGNYEPVSEEFIRQIKEWLDPDEFTGQGIGYAPIGHRVTVTTPYRQYVDVRVVVEIVASESLDTIRSSVQSKINEYFDDVRREFYQDVESVVYRSHIINKVLELSPVVISVQDVLINGAAADLKLEDIAIPGGQPLPYLNEPVDLGQVSYV